MNVRDLDGNLSLWHIIGHINNNYNKSSYHLQARELIKKIYPTMKILEEVPIYIRKSEVLYLDFYMPLIKTCIEVHGEQHYNQIAFYHPNKLAYLKAKKRDQEKKEWCELNNINYIELPYNEINNWEDKIGRK
jgi:hypothetical protein